MHKSKNFDPVREIKRTLMFYGFWIGFIVLIFLLASCESSKHMDKSAKSVESETKIDSSAYYHEQVDQLQRKLDEELKSKKTGITFNPARQPIHTTTYQADCPPCAANEILIKPDGSIHAKGDINSFALQEDHYKKQILELIDERELEINRRMTAEEKLKEAEKNKTVVKETRVLTSWWMWYLAGCLTMIVLAVWLKWKHNKKEILNNKN